MNITLPPEQLEWIEAEVAAGRFESIDDAVAAAVAELMSLANDDLAWARPYVEQARASVARGDVLSGDEFFQAAPDQARFASLFMTRLVVTADADLSFKFEVAVQLVDRCADIRAHGAAEIV